MSQEERIAENEAFCRDLNRSKEEWREVRSRPERFAIAPGHVAVDVEPGIEEIVKQYEHFWIVEKRGEAGEIAAERA
jgi:hypothetical protein